MQDGEYNEDQRNALVRRVGYFTCGQPKLLSGCRQWWDVSPCPHTAPYRSGGHSVVSGWGWQDPLLLPWVWKCQRRQQGNWMVGKGNSSWGGKWELHLPRVLTGKFSMKADPPKKIRYSLWVWFCRFWYKLPFPTEEITPTPPWWAISIKISKWARFGLTVCFPGTNWWHIQFTVQENALFWLVWEWSVLSFFPKGI